MGKKKRHSLHAENTQVFSGPSYSVADPALAEFLGLSRVGWGSTTELQALGLTAYYRANAIVSGTIAGLPLKVFDTDIEDEGGSTRHEVKDHWLTANPAGPFDLSAFSWTEMVVLHLMNHGEAFLKHIHNAGGELIGLWPVHPLAVNNVKWVGPDKAFTVAMANGVSEDLSGDEMTQVLGMSLDGVRGLSPLALFRQSLETSRAGEIAANRQFTSGSLIAGLVTTEEDVEETEAKTIKESLRAKMSGAEHAGDIAFVNRSLKFTPWMMTNADAEFLGSRSFQVEEVSRMTGVPLHLLSSVVKTTSWGTGIQEQDLALSKYTLSSFTDRIESALRRVLPPTQFPEFGYSGLLAGTPAQEIALLIAQVTAGLLTVDEARAIRNLPALTDAQKAASAPPAPAMAPMAPEPPTD